MVMPTETANGMVGDEIGRIRSRHRRLRRMKMTDVEHRVVDIDATRAHAYNQVNVRRLRSGDLVAGLQRGTFRTTTTAARPSCCASRDGGETWTDRTVVLPYTDTTGNWDCGICELGDGTLLVNLSMAAYFKRGIRSEQPSWTRGPRTSEYGDWTWSYKTMSWLGAYVLRSTDGARPGANRSRSTRGR